MPRSLSHTEDEDEDTAGTVTTAVCRESTQGLRLAVLYDAAAAGDLARLEAAIEATPGDLEFAPPDERQRNPTPLFVAARGGYAAVVARLLAAGADKAPKKDCGTTALYIASQEGHEASAEYQE